MDSARAPHMKVRSDVSDYLNYDIINRHYNYTGKLNDNAESGIKATSVVFIIICCFIILENIFVLLTIWKTKKFHRPMYYFIGNLALSDLLAGVAYIANILLSGSTTYTLTPAQWFLREGSMFVALSASVFSLLAIAIERYITMLKMKLHNGSNSFRSFLLISACWVISVILGGLPIMGWNCIGSLENCSTVLPLYHKHYILFCTSIFTGLLLAIVILYCRIYILVRTRSRRLTFRKNVAKATRSSEKSLALLKTVIIVLSVFIVCWTPLFILLLLDVRCKVKACPILFKAEYFLVLAVLNSATNPIIYTLTNKEMRRAFLKIVRCCTCPTTDSGTKVKRPIIGGIEFSRSKSDNSSHPQKDEGDPPETIVSSGNVTSSS